MDFHGKSMVVHGRVVRLIHEWVGTTSQQPIKVAGVYKLNIECTVISVAGLGRLESFRHSHGVELSQSGPLIKIKGLLVCQWSRGYCLVISLGKWQKETSKLVLNLAT